MRRRLLAAYARQWRGAWPQRLREFVGVGAAGAAWREGYGLDRRGLRALGFEALVRSAELLGVGLLYSAGETWSAGHRYRPLSERERSFAAAYFSELELGRSVVDEGASLVAGRLGIAYVSGFAVKAPATPGPSILLHELVHTRQFARWGWAYVAKCLAAQWWGGGYGYPGARLREAVAKTHPTTPTGSYDARLNGEQEAARVEDLARGRLGLAPRHGR